MNVRIDWQQQSPAPQPRRSSSGPGGPRKRKFGKDARLFGALGIGAAAVIVAALVVDDDGKGGVHKNASPSASPSVSASANTGGMVRGEATAAGSGCADRVSGLPWGCPRTTAGAVEAATQVMAANYQMERMTSEDRAAWVKAVFAEVPADTESAAKLYQDQNNLNASGQLINPTDGQPVTDQRFTSLCHPELGAYRVKSSSADSVKLDVWQVCVSGTIGPGTARNLSANWMVGEISLAWKGENWQVTKTGSGGFTMAPTPADTGKATTTYAERARILAAYGGTGWTLYADASESAPAELEGTQ
ncbi:hypothetical protein [Streptomyces sp. NPDC053726]|uniref:hypothetical protein n=1 Tax=Streptomyces sp. NPDC053726 TaxID=3365713 RepID=UPI0037D72948